MMKDPTRFATISTTALPACSAHISLRYHHTQMRIALLLLLIAASASPAQTTDPDSLLKAGILAQQQGDYSVAIEDYQRVLKVRPDLAELRANLGAALAHEGRFQEAITQDRLALAAMPRNNEIKMNLGLAYFKKGDYPKAQDIFKQVQQESPDNLQVAILLGDSEVRSGNAQAAVALLTPLEQANAQNPDFEYVLGSALIQTGNLHDGVARIQKVAETTRAPDSYLLAGSTYIDLHEFDHAKTDLEEALRLDPALPRVHALTGMARDMTGGATAPEPQFREE